MITMCMCMVIVGFASEGKQAIIMQEKAMDYKVSKRMTDIQKIHKAEAYSMEKKLDALRKIQPLDNPIENRDCVDTDNGATDPYGDGCAAYNSYPSWCGGYDDDDFISGEMCCICGGGSTGGRATVDSDSGKIMKTQLHSKLDGTYLRNVAIKHISAEKRDFVANRDLAKIEKIKGKDLSLPVYEKKAMVRQIGVKHKGIKAANKSLYKRIDPQMIKEEVKNPADVIKSGASLERKATGFESKLPRANSVKLIQTAEGLKYEADGFVGFEITLSHGNDFEINVTKSAFIADYRTTGNTTKVIVVAPGTDELFSSTGEYTVVDVIAGTSGGTALTAEIVSIPTVFGLNDAYPNPFNPTTSVELAMPVDGFVSVKVYNLMGQLVSTLHEGDLTANSYSFMWDASNVASGMYFLQAEAAGNVDVQKIMLMK